MAYFNFETNSRLNETFGENISPDYLIPVLSHIARQTIPVEVKSADNTRAKRLKVYMETYRPDYVIKLSTKNF